MAADIEVQGAACALFKAAGEVSSVVSEVNGAVEEHPTDVLARLLPVTSQVVVHEAAPSDLRPRTVC